MRADVADIVERLHAARATELLRLVDEALSDGVEPLPDPDVVEPYRWFVAGLGDGVKLTAAGCLPPAGPRHHAAVRLGRRLDRRR
jgi:hypothetical protein